MSSITRLEATEILDSRGKPTLEIKLWAGDLLGFSQVPAGKSTGIHEAAELRDDTGSVRPALEVIEKIIKPAIIGQRVNQDIDKLLLELDGTENKQKLGGNTLIGLSMAVARLAAKVEKIELWEYLARLAESTPKLPKLFMNVINGGVHADFRLPFQEYMVVVESYEQGKNLFEKLKEKVMARYGREIPYGDEGGLSPEIINLEEPFQILTELIAGEDGVNLAIDAAASEFWQDGAYTLKDQVFSAAELNDFYLELTEKYPLRSIEDPFAEDEVESFQNLTRQAGKKFLVVGDDLTVTNPKRLKIMVEAKAATALIIKPNQVGTISETIETAKLARENDWEIIVSHRSGDTLDDFITDLAYGLGAYGLKAGSPEPPERRAKYERLEEIKKGI
ncbi:MAG: enolase C-terminal domain-like protein [Patescibacteria group bacterium]